QRYLWIMVGLLRTAVRPVSPGWAWGPAGCCRLGTSAWMWPMAWKGEGSVCTCSWEVCCDGTGCTVWNASTTSSPAASPTVALAEGPVAGGGSVGRADGRPVGLGPV